MTKSCPVGVVDFKVKLIYVVFVFQSNDKYWRHKQVLWVWFLTEPKKVIKSLKSISTEAQQRSKNAAPVPRHIAGIMRKS